LCLFHCGRHTCATTIALSNGMPMESLAKLLGHKNIRTTQFYARITDTKLNANMESLEERLALVKL
jgi:site-specific recombinase XerD